ncbi:MAG: DUF433 domain-containing protein [Chloroflexi bacterium]|nr:DUF433 domain-containing protein [Chloroflexota bacterium]
MAREIASRIVADPEVRFGRPVEVLVAKLAAGMTPAEVSDEYGVTLEDVRAACASGARAVAR